MNSLDHARAYYAAGLSTIPTKTDGSKAPALPPGHPVLNRERMPTEAELSDWFGRREAGIGVLGGSISGNLECLDFDEEADRIYPLWAQMVAEEHPGLVEKLVLVRTPSGGYHHWYRTTEAVSGKQLLAADPSKPKGARQTLIETRGEACYALTPGSPPKAHETGKLYEYLVGNLAAEVPVITREDQSLLHRCAKRFDRRQVKKAQQHHQANGHGSDDQRPGDQFDVEGPPWEEILTPHNWELAYEKGDYQAFRRPGKERGISATAGHCKGPKGEPLLHVFTTSAAPLEPGTFGRFRAYALLNHSGDLAAAARQLRQQGYGSQGHSTPGPRPSPNGQRHVPSSDSPSDGAAAEPEPPTTGDPPWPDSLAAEAYYGLAGECVRFLEPGSEADPAALLFSLLAAFGNVVGPRPHFVVEGDTHNANEFVVLVGKTSKGRKGTSWGRVRQLFQGVDQAWLDNCVTGGLSSGEGLIWQIRDPIVSREKVRDKGTVRYEQAEADPGVADKRLLTIEVEFASILRHVERNGNTLSTTLRQAWESGSLKSLTKSNTARSTGAHVSMIGHCTADELRRYLSTTEAASGFGNRILWVATKRSKCLAEGGWLDLGLLGDYQRRIAEAVAFARDVEQVRRDDEAREIWRQIYPELSEGKPGLTGSLLGRAEAHVLRLSMLYALLDQSYLIRADHLTAAVALHEYVEASVRHIWGDSLGDPVADDILRLLRTCPDGVTRTDISAAMGRNTPSGRISRALTLLAEHGFAHCRKAKTAGRPEERWHTGRAR